MDFTPNLAEIWTLYAVGTIMIGARVFVRTKLVGIQGYRADDYLVWLTWVRYPYRFSVARRDRGKTD
jgi:hypothetical protein